MKYMETTTWEVCSFIGVLLKKSRVLLTAAGARAYLFYRSAFEKKAECFWTAAGARAYLFYRSAFEKKQSAFGTATLLVNYILLKSELVRVFGGKWPFRHVKRLVFIGVL